MKFTSDTYFVRTFIFDNNISMIVRADTINNKIEVEFKNYKTYTINQPDTYEEFQEMEKVNNEIIKFIDDKSKDMEEAMFAIGTYQKAFQFMYEALEREEENE